jgi:hypothetical protein
MYSGVTACETRRPSGQQDVLVLEVVDTPNVPGHPPTNSLFGSTGKKLSGVSFIKYGDNIHRLFIT